MREFKVIGHRGACAHEPENTLRSIRRGIADGADMIEIDVRLAGGEIIVIHDATVDRTTDGSGSIYAKSSAEIRALDAGGGEVIPTLAEALALTLGVLPLNIEIKDSAVTAAVCELLEGSGRFDPEQIILSSFLPEAIIEARQRLPDSRIGILAHDTPESIVAMFALAAQLGATSVHPHINSINPELVLRAHDQNFLVYPYTAREPGHIARILDCHADGCFADDPKWAAGLARTHL